MYIYIERERDAKLKGRDGAAAVRGNFGGNQLLDGSISLLPPYPDSTNDLHVSIATSLHQSFLWLHPTQA